MENIQNLPIGGGKSTSPKKRDSNLDLLRALCAVFVVFEHFCETTAHNAFGFSETASMPAHTLLRLMYGIARVAVPVFFLLSGYLSINSTKQRIGKVINLFFMTAAYSCISYVMVCVYGVIKGENNFSILHFMKTCIPINYYLYLFCGVYMLSPFFNSIVKSLKRENYLRLIIVAFILFSGWSTLVNTCTAIASHEDFTGIFFTSLTGTSMGFNIANFTTMYLIGGYIRLYHKTNIKKDRKVSLLVILSSTVITSTFKIISPTISKAFLYYDSIFVTSSAIAMVILFLTIEIKPNKVITFLAMHTYGTFLIHGLASSCIEKIISIESVVSKGFIGTIVGIIIFVIGVYILALIMTVSLETIAQPIKRKWKETKLYNYTIYNGSETE